MTLHKSIAGILACMLIGPQPGIGVDLSPSKWKPEDKARAELAEKTPWPSQARLVEGKSGLVAATMSPIAVHAGVETLRQGGTAADAAATVNVPDLRHVQPGFLSDPAVAQLTCDSGNVDALLGDVLLAHDNIRVDFSYDSYTKEIQCANAAVSLQPESFALQYIAGMTNDDHEYNWPSSENHPKNLRAAIEHFRATIILAPNFYEAREGLAEALQNSGAFADAEKEYLKLAEQGSPPPIQQEAEESLTRLYDEINDRPHALLAVRKAEEIHEPLSSLAGKEHDRTFNDGRNNLAAREEEAGEYAQAAIDYLAARNFSSKDDFEAKYYEYDPGRARSLRESGDASGAAALCKHRRSRAFDPLHKLRISP